MLVTWYIRLVIVLVHENIILFWDIQQFLLFKSFDLITFKSISSAIIYVSLYF